MAIITIIGAGMMGSAMATPARDNGHEVRLVGTPLDKEIIDVSKKTNRHPKFDKDFPEGIKFYQIEDVKQAIENADAIVCGVSSFGVDWFGENILPIIDENTPILSITKGLVNLNDGRLITYPEYWKKFTKAKRNINAVGGPCISFDLAWRDDTVVSFCGEDMNTLRKLKEYFQTSYYHISITNDIVGVESAVALKNGYALGVALTIGQQERKTDGDKKLRYNCQAGVFGQALRECTKILEFQGSNNLNSQVIFAGDLYVTVFGGRTRKIGVLLGKGLNIDEAKEVLNGVTLESLVIIERVAKAVKLNAEKGMLDPKDFPFLLHVYDLIVNKKPLNIPWKDFTYEG